MTLSPRGDLLPDPEFAGTVRPMAVQPWRMDSRRPAV